MFAAGAYAPRVAADPTGQITMDTLSQQIVTNCQSIKRTLSQLHASDGPLRVNRGQTYDFISTRLMAPFNSRLLLNKVDASSLVKITAQYDGALNNFRSHYIEYDDQLGATIGIDCSKQPSAFHDALTKTRQLRDQVHDDVGQMNQLIKQYEKTVDGVHDQWRTAGTMQNGASDGK